MKRILYVAILVVLTGCTSNKTVPIATPSQKESQDLSFSIAFESLLKTSHEAEMTAISQQKETLARIESSLASIDGRLEASSNPVNASEPEKATEPPKIEGSVPSDVPEPPEVDSTGGGELVSTEKETNLASAGEWPDGIRVIFWYGVPCKPCEEQKPIIDQLEDMGVQVTRYKVFWIDEGETFYGEKATKYNVSTAPQVWLVRNDRAIKKYKGLVELETILNDARKLSEVVVTQSSSISRNPGPRWNWEGRWNVSENFASNHLQNDHGIDATGLSMEEMEILHDNAHNGSRSVARTSSQRNVRYSTPTRTRFFGLFRSRSSCPGGNCP